MVSVAPSISDNMDNDNQLPFQYNLEEKISLPLIVNEWMKKHYPKKCCISIREYYDKEINFTTSIETSTLSQLVITPNAKLNSAPGCAYRIEVEMDNVMVSHDDTEEWSDGMGRTVWLENTPMDWHSPDFFKNLKKAIGCQCKKLAKKPKNRRSRTS
jgi:hypothetical protein